MFKIKSAPQIFHKISKDRFYLVTEYIYDCIFWFAMSMIASLFFRTSDWNFYYYDLIAIFLAVLMGWSVSSFIHNCSHSNVKYPILNRLIGEFCGLWVMYGFKNFILIHHLHHKYSDQELDPVNPEGMSFFIFLSAPMRYMIKTGAKYLEEKHGHHDDYKMIKFGHYFFFHISVVFRISFIFFVLGAKYFFIFYMVSLLSNIFILAHINYVCHRDKRDGSVEIVNLNHNLYYKFANFVTCGGYYHKNHHLNQNLFDPRTLDTKRAHEPLFSKGPSSLSNNLVFLKVKKRPIAEYFDLSDVWGEKPEEKLNSSKKLYWKSILRL